MADTARTLTALQTLFADNSSGAISEQDLRDFLVTALPENEVDVRSYGAKWDGTTDDASAVQDALDAVSGAGVVTLPPGTGIIGTALVCKSGVTLRGAGVDVTTIKVKDSADVSAITVGSGITRACIRDLTIDGNKANQTDAVHGIACQGDTQTMITNVRVTSCKGDGIRATSNTDVAVIGCISTANAMRGIELTNVTGARIEGNLVTSNGTHGIDVDFQTSNAIVVGNKSLSNTSTGIFVEEGTDDVTVAGNTSNSNGTYGIAVASATNGRTTERVTISGNICRANTQSGILVAATTASGAVCRDVTVVGNVCMENDQGDTGHHGILISCVVGGTCENIIISSNRCGDRQGEATQTYGLGIGANTGEILVVGNDFSDNVTGGVDNGGSNVTIRSNIGVEDSA